VKLLKPLAEHALSVGVGEPLVTRVAIGDQGGSVLTMPSIVRATSAELASAVETWYAGGDRGIQFAGFIAAD
jgi:hypothetical protein